MSNISSRYQLSGSPPQAQLFPRAEVIDGTPKRPTRAKREDSSSQTASTSTQWTLQPVPAASSDADRQLQVALAASAMRVFSDSIVQIPSGSTIYPGFDALRSAFNTPEIQAWILSKGIALDTVVVKPGSVSGVVYGSGAPARKTFTTGDDSGWWQVSASLREAAYALDVTGKGVSYIRADSDRFSRDAVLRGYGVTPPTGADDLADVRGALSAADWSALPSETKLRLEARTQRVRETIDARDERAHLVSTLSQFVRGKSDDDAVSLANVTTPISTTSALAVGGVDKAAVDAVLASHGFPAPESVAQVRNTIRWLDAKLAPVPDLGNYAQLIARPWVPGALSEADRGFAAQLGDDDSGNNKPAQNVLRVLDIGGILHANTPDALRVQADSLLDQILSSRVAQLWGEAVARSRGFLGESGSFQMSLLESKQWALAAIMLQIDPQAPGTPGILAGYDIYQPANHGRTLEAVRADIEAHLLKNPLLDAKTAPLVAHLFLASVAPEFLIRDVPPTLRMGSTEWADLRLGVTFAERQGGAGSSRAMNYPQVMALARLDARTPEEAAVLYNQGVDVLMDWGLMQGLYSKPTGGRYTPQQYAQATLAFDAQREHLLHALKAFNVPLPTRRDLAIGQLQRVFPDLSRAQLQGLNVQIADPNERRNMKLSEPRTRSLIETYMTGELVKGRWMLSDANTLASKSYAPKTPFQFNKVPTHAEKAATDKKVQALNARIESLPDVQAQLSGKVDTYLADLKQGLSTITRKMISNLPLAERQALEHGAVELFAIREQTDGVPTVEQTSDQIEELRGRQGTLIRSEYNGVTRYFEVFPAKMLIRKREDLPNQLTLGGTLEDRLKVYGNWAPSTTQLQNGAEQPFDFRAYSTDAMPRSGVTSPGIIIDKLGETLAAAPADAGGVASVPVPNSFSSTRTLAIVDRIMQGNFIHHRDTVLKYARGELKLEQEREISQRNDGILLGMIPFVGAITDLAKGNIVEGMRGLIIDTTGALLGGAGSSVRVLAKSTKVVAPFGAKAFRVLEKGVSMVSAFLNPLDGSADLIVSGAKGIIAVPKFLSRGPKAKAFASMLAAQEKLRTYFGVQTGMRQSVSAQDEPRQAGTPSGQNHAIPVHAVQSNGIWYAVNPKNGLPIGTPLDGYKPSGTVAA